MEKKEHKCELANCENGPSDAAIWKVTCENEAGDDETWVLCAGCRADLGRDWKSEERLNKDPNRCTHPVAEPFDPSSSEDDDGDDMDRTESGKVII